jgi:hypothetical protein
MSSYAKNIYDIDASLKRMAEGIKKLKSNKKMYQDKLYAFMCKNNVDEITHENVVYKKSKLAPKTLKAKPIAMKKEELLTLYSNIGVDIPEELLKQTQEILKSKIERNEN